MVTPAVLPPAWDTLPVMRLRPPDPEYRKLLDRYTEAIRNLALATRKLILKEVPDAGEFVYEVYTIADHFSFTDRPSDAFVFTTAHTNWVNLGFNFGAMLPNPQGLLQGDGKLIRVGFTPETLAFQLFYHEVHHRAQVMAMLRQLGIAAEGLDFNRYAFQWTEPAPT